MHMIVLVVWGDAVLMIFNHRGSSTVPDRQTHSDHPFQPQDSCQLHRDVTESFFFSSWITFFQCCVINI